MKKREPRSREELRAAMAHISYEWQAFNSAGSALEKAARASAAPVNMMHVQLAMVRAALVDSLAIHARSLLHFVYPRGEQPDDILAQDFIPEWETLCPSSPADLDTFRRRVNKLVAHLAYDRIELTREEELNWVMPGLIEALGAAWKVFLSNLPEDLKEPPGAPVQYHDGRPIVAIPRWPTLKGAS
jgi:hypothetical protein